MLSSCEHNKKAVIIGIDYEGDPNNELQTAISDTFHLRIELDLIRGFPRDKTRIYTDVEDENRLPTKENIIRAMKWLVKSAQKDDSLFFTMPVMEVSRMGTVSSKLPMVKRSQTISYASIWSMTSQRDVV